MTRQRVVTMRVLLRSDVKKVEERVGKGMESVSLVCVGVLMDSKVLVSF